MDIEKSLGSICTYINDLRKENEHLRQENARLTIDRGLWLEKDLTATERRGTKRSADASAQTDDAKRARSDDESEYSATKASEVTIPYVCIVDSKLAPYLVDGRFYFAFDVMRHLNPRLKVRNMLKCKLESFLEMCNTYKMKKRSSLSSTEQEIMDKSFDFVKRLKPDTFLTYYELTYARVNDDHVSLEELEELLE